MGDLQERPDTATACLHARGWERLAKAYGRPITDCIDAYIRPEYMCAECRRQVTEHPDHSLPCVACWYEGVMERP